MHSIPTLITISTLMGWNKKNYISLFYFIVINIEIIIYIRLLLEFNK